jgi:hypothetical protein
MGKRNKRTKKPDKPPEDDKTYLLCCPASHDWAAVEGTRTGYHCSRCNGEVMLAPSGQRIFARGDIYLLCTGCAAKDKDAKFDIRMPHAREVILELEGERAKMIDEMLDPTSLSGRKEDLARQVGQIEDTQRWLSLEHFKNTHRN